MIIVCNLLHIRESGWVNYLQQALLFVIQGDKANLIRDDSVSSDDGDYNQQISTPPNSHWSVHSKHKSSYAGGKMGCGICVYSNAPCNTNWHK